MRIVITKLGKIEIKDDEYNFNSENSNNKSIFRNISVSYNKIKNNIALKGSQTSRKIISIPKLRFNKYNTITKESNNKNIFSNDKINETTFLPKIKDTLSPKKFNSLMNSSERIFKKAIKVNQKKLNIPNNMFDKYSEKIVVGDLFKKEEEPTKVNQTENNLFSEKNNKVYSLRDILIPKNKKNLDESFLDTKFNINGEKSIINYLQKDKAISPFYIQKVSQLKNGELIKMDKICQKYLNDEVLQNKLDNVIKKKIKIGYEREAIKYEKDLKNMKNKLMNYNTIYQKLRLKKENYDNYKLMYLSTIK
jgi:hypothetical protein